ncbi:MAG: UDP-N-acetylglucosamine 2-epimerase (non-hydrolyzing) [Elusimicrobia bacterium]|nr:UDP-N-acetylglucosamine 2-epimerase (non-hydrolyzing) [Candidatus Obscuribacterium magneticum]
MSKLKIVTIVGARPQFVKAASLSKILRTRFREVLVNTGQHYDFYMSQIFFDQLAIPKPDYNLGVGSGSHAWQTGALLTRIEKVLLREKPDWVLVYGDTNSTLAGALAAAKLRIPLIHVEAGLRSHDMSMPEEVNRIITDHVSTLLFCPTKTATNNLKKEGIAKGVYNVGDVMCDAFLDYIRKIKSRGRETYIPPKPYALATIHRAGNTDSKIVLKHILRAFGQIPMPIYFLIHPRTLKAIKKLRIQIPKNIRIKKPKGYLDMLALEKGATLILTDSGGVQKEAYFCHVPCLTLRDNTEWTETLSYGWNTLVGSRPRSLLGIIRTLNNRIRKHPNYFGQGNAAHKIAQIIGSFTK